jgi:predicted HTH transcriptional regulator
MRYTDDQIRHVLVRLKDTPSEELESETLEFKGYQTESALHNAKDLPEEISALANKSGGLILLGVRDSSNVPSGEWNDQLQGIEETDNKTVQERLRGKIQPVVDLRVRSINFEGKHYVAIAVPHRSDTLVSTRSGKVYIRDSRTSRPMTPIEIERTVKSLSTYDWSSEELTREWENLLDHTLIDEAIAHFSVLRHLEKNPCPHSYLESIGATRNGWLTSGGLVLLGKADAIRQHLGEFEYRFSWKKPNGTLITNDVWAGSIWSAIKRARNHFALCNVTATFEDEGRRFQVPAIDEIAFHEAYLNALVHRDYSSDGMVSVNYTGQRLIVTSPGTFYGGVTAENILRHEPRHRNKNLARMLMLHNLVDRAGMGVLRMGRSSLKYGRAFPEFREAGDSVEVSMSAEYLRPAITVLSADNPTWGIPELLIINSVYESGFVAAPTLERHLARVSDDSWSSIVSAVGNMEQVELCGTNRGVYVRVAGHWKSLLRVSRAFRVSGTSAKHVKLYAYLKRHGDASNSDISELLGHKHSSQTSAFLRNAEYAKRTGVGPGARWSLVELTT